MTKIETKPLLIFTGLGLLMAITRSTHFGDTFNFPDASLAIFFAAGFYVAGVGLFVALMCEAVAIDWIATSVGGVSDWCMSPAYWFLVPTYLALWAAGRWYANRHTEHWSTVVSLAIALWASTSVAFLISNGSFYTLSGRFPEMSFAEYSERVAQYYPPYVGYAFLYVGIFAVGYVAFKYAQRHRRISDNTTRTVG